MFSGNSSSLVTFFIIQLSPHHHHLSIFKTWSTLNLSVVKSNMTLSSSDIKTPVNCNENYFFCTFQLPHYSNVNELVKLKVSRLWPSDLVPVHWQLSLSLNSVNTYKHLGPGLPLCQHSTRYFNVMTRAAEGRKISRGSKAWEFWKFCRL